MRWSKWIVDRLVQRSVQHGIIGIPAVGVFLLEIGSFTNYHFMSTFGCFINYFYLFWRNLLFIRNIINLQPSGDLRLLNLLRSIRLYVFFFLQNLSFNHSLVPILIAFNVALVDPILFDLKCPL